MTARLQIITPIQHCLTSWETTSHVESVERVPTICIQLLSKNCTPTNVIHCFDGTLRNVCICIYCNGLCGIQCMDYRSEMHTYKTAAMNTGIAIL